MQYHITVMKTMYAEIVMDFKDTNALDVWTASTPDEDLEELAEEVGWHEETVQISEIYEE